MNPIDKACELIKQPGDSKRIFIDNIEIFKEIYSRKASYINELDKKSFEVVLFMIENEEQEIFEYFHEDIISMIKMLQEEVCFELRINKKPTDEDIDKIFENIYFHEELSKKLSNLKILESTDDFTKGTVKSYINSTIYRDSISALIIAINKSYFSLSPEKISQVIKYIKTSDWIKRYSEGLEKNVMLDRDFAYQYIDKFLSIKEFCIDEEAKDDILLNGILTGKIKDKKLLYQSLDKLAIETVVYFYDEDLNNLFKSLENIDYLSEMEKQEIFIKVSNKLLDEKKYIYLYRLLVSNDNPYFNMYFKKEKDKIIYYALNDNPLNLSEKEINYLIENGYATTNFLDNVKSVYSRVDEIESMDIAIERLRKGIFEPNEIDDKTLKQIIRKIINECLKSFDIDIGNKIIFCDSKIDDGYYTIDQCLIMINNNLITKFIEKKIMPTCL